MTAYLIAILIDVGRIEPQMLSATSPPGIHSPITWNFGAQEHSKGQNLQLTESNLLSFGIFSIKHGYQVAVLWGFGVLNIPNSGKKFQQSMRP